MTSASTVRLEQATYLAERGWHVFPAVDKATPLVQRWQEVATTDLAQVAQWWGTWPEAIVCVVPGLSGKAAVDIDLHPGKASGFDSAVMAGAPVDALVSGVSVGGEGRHLWFDGAVPTAVNVNGLASIDVRSVGGYIAMSRYGLPHVDEVTEPLPDAYRPAERTTAPRVRREVGAWLRAHQGPMGEALAEYVASTPDPFRGRNDLHRRIKRIVCGGAEGLAGATTALELLRDRWTAAEHNEGPEMAEQEFRNSLEAHIAEHGETVQLNLSRLLGEQPAAPAAKNAPAGRHLVVTSLDAVEPEVTEWLWQDVIPLGVISILAAEAGSGKSTVAAWLTSQVSRGALSGDLEGQPIVTLIAAGEDDLTRTLKPRLTAAEADTSRVRMFQPRTGPDGVLTQLQLVEDLAALRATIVEQGARLVILDPILSFVDGSPDRAKEVRAALDPLAALARELNIAVLCIAHFNKSGARAGHRLSGSHAWRDIARSLLVLVKDRKQPERVVVTLEKSNYGRAGASFAFTIEEVQGSVGRTSRVVFGGESSVSVQDLLDRDAREAEKTSMGEDRQAVITFVIEHGPATTEQVYDYMDAESAPERNAVRNHLSRSVRSGHIASPTRGTYAAVGGSGLTGGLLDEV